MVFSINNPGDLLESLEILNLEDELNFESMNIIQNENYNIIDISDIEKLSEEYLMDINEVLETISLINNIDPNSIKFSIDETVLIENMNFDYADEFVIKPIQKMDPVFLFCEACVSLYEETMDQTYLDMLLEDLSPTFYYARGSQRDALIRKLRNASTPEEKLKLSHQIKEFDHKTGEIEYAEKIGAIKRTGKQDKEGWGSKVKRHALDAYNSMRHGASNAVQWAKDNPYKTAGGALAVATAAGGALAYKNHRDNQRQEAEIQRRLELLRRQAENKPKSWLGKKIASLRSIYQNYLQRAKMAKDAGTASIFKTIASKILGCIDYLLEKLQHAVG